jgi:carboxylate-amine ligase
VGDEQRLPYDELLRRSFEQYENAEDFTLAVEEEFAILDAETLELTDRFEALQAMSRGTPVEDHLVGELIASEVEVRTGRADRFPEAAVLMGERRAQLLELAAAEGVELAAAGTHPWSAWQAQRIIDTPHYRRNDEILRYVVWRNNSFGLHVHVGIRGADRAVRVTSGLRPFMPDLLALSASSPFVENVYTGLHSARTQIFTRMFPRCGVPDPLGSWREFEDYVRLLYETGSITEHTQLWWSVRSHLAFPTVEMRICDAQPDLADARSLAALIYALTARVARAIDEGEPLPDPPPRLIEENLWRAIRYGLSGDLIDLSTHAVRPARAAIEELVDWVMPVAEELGAASSLNVPVANSAERQISRFEEGASLREIYGELLVRQEEPVRG